MLDVVKESFTMNKSKVLNSGVRKEIRGCITSDGSIWCPCGSNNKSQTWVFMGTSTARLSLACPLPPEAISESGVLPQARPIVSF